MLMKETIMTEKIARRGIKVPSEYAADFLDSISVDEILTPNVVSFDANETIANVRNIISSEELKYNSFPIVDSGQRVVGIISRADIENARAHEDMIVRGLVSKPFLALLKNNTVKETANLLAEHDIHSLPVVLDYKSMKLCGIVSMNDILKARKRKINESKYREKTFNIASAFGNKNT